MFTVGRQNKSVTQFNSIEFNRHAGETFQCIIHIAISISVVTFIQNFGVIHPSKSQPHRLFQALPGASCEQGS